MEKEILNYLLETFKCSELVAEVMLSDLCQYVDIFSEFINWFTTKKFSDVGQALKVEGYSAEELFNSFPIHEVGAFSLLVSLRNDKEATLDYISQGLPLH